MPIDVIGFAVAKVEAEKQGVTEPESTRLGVIGSMLGSPLMAFVAARSMASNQVQQTAPAPEPLPTISLVRPPRTDEPVNEGESPDGAEAAFKELIKGAVTEVVEPLSTEVRALKQSVARIEDKLGTTPPPPSPAPSEGGQGTEQTSRRGGTK